MLEKLALGLDLPKLRTQLIFAVPSINIPNKNIPDLKYPSKYPTKKYP